MDNAKKLKRGEILFKEGDAPTVIYMVQTGKMGLMLERGGKFLEITTIGPSGIVGEQALFSNGRHAFTAQALQETKLLEIPVDLMKQQFEKSPTGIKLMAKSLVEEVRQARQATKQHKMETEKTPCPQGLVHRLFTEVHLIARHIGKKAAENPDEIVVAWNALKLYASRFFGESPQRLRHLMDLLLKLKLAEFKVSTNDEGEEELTDVKLFRVQLYEDFAEFFQYHLFKGSRAEAIFVDPLALKVAKAMVEVSEGCEVDHKGATKLDYQKLLTECKTKYRIDLKNTHLDALERKGLFAQRKSYDDGRVDILFDRAEFIKMAQFWAILLEIDKWNERGSIDLNEKEDVAAGPAGECPGCKGKIESDHKFCPQCGFKMAA
ncbi:MAG TPA: cyclic nucleotide-binding domain-containing protein [Bdellovibrionales bacterium]|nr:cyclic nucleotide-binding domain-containing protein [Bdellovibrionales bacterium]